MVPLLDEAIETLEDFTDANNWLDAFLFLKHSDQDVAFILENILLEALRFVAELDADLADTATRFHISNPKIEELGSGFTMQLRNIRGIRLLSI